LQWFIGHLVELSAPENRKDSETKEAGKVLDGSSIAPIVENVSLPLTADMSSQFNLLLKRYRQLAETTLFTLRIEMRLRVMHYVDRAMKEGLYQLTEDVAEPDPFVVDLNSELAQCDECAASTLGTAERNFVLIGLAELMDSVLISNAGLVQRINHPGINKMLRNILALQQNLRNLGDSPFDVDFRSRRYWDLARTGDPKYLIENIRRNKVDFSFDEAQTLLAIICGIDLLITQDDGSVPLSGTSDRLRRLYNESLIDLHANFGSDW